MALVEGDWPFLEGCIVRFVDQQSAWLIRGEGDDDGETGRGA
jgi:hypothetical protein